MHIIGRRNFLNGLGLGAGAHLLGSFFKTTVREAMGAEPAKRLIVFTSANGLLERFYNCANRGEADFDLGPVYQPVAAFKKNMVIASKFFNPFSKALHGNQHATMTVMESTNPGVSQERGPPGGISIDRLIGKKIGASDAFSSTVSGRGISVSADGAGQSVPLISSPKKAFDTYLGGAVTMPGMPGNAGGTFQTDFNRDKSFLDTVRADVNRVNARLAGPERAKLEQYLESLRTLEEQIGRRAQTQSGCTKPASPAEGALDVNIKSHIDVVFAAQRCGLTHVSHIAFEGMEGPKVVYSWLGDSRNHHDDHHANDMGMVQKIYTWWFERIGQMLTLLSTAPEGSGTMLDNSLVVFLNTCGGSHHRGYNNHPMIFWGGAGGQLKTGRYLTYPEGRHCMSDAYVSIGNMFGLELTKFGAPNHCKGPLPGLV
jgi:Protein of unknown function (DUF1552)